MSSSRLQLLKAIRKGDSDTVTSILDNETAENRSSLLSSRSKKGETICHTAIQTSSADVVVALFDRKEVDIDIYDGEYGYTLAIATIAFGASDIQVIRKLLSRDPDLTLRDKTETGNSAFHWAAALNRIGVLEEMLKAKKQLRDIPNGLSETPLHVAIRASQEEAASLLIQNKADVNAKDDEWQTPLHAAVACRLPNIVNMIVSTGELDVAGCVDKQGNTPLHIAAQMQQSRVASLLRDAGFSPTFQNFDNKTPSDFGGASFAEEKEKQLKEREDAKKNKLLRKRLERQDDMETTEVTKFLKKYGCGYGGVELLYQKRYRYLDDDFWQLTDARLSKLGLKSIAERYEVLKCFEVHKEELHQIELEEERKLRDAEKNEQRRRLFVFIGLLFSTFGVIFLGLWTGILPRVYRAFKKG